MFPASPASYPAVLNMWYMSDVVVVLPFEPVMHIIFELVYRPANSISLMICMPLSVAFLTIGASLGMPGLFIISSAARILASVCCFSSHSILWSLSIFLYLSLMADMSLTNTSKPSFFASTAAPAPLSPAPRITIFFILLFIGHSPIMGERYLLSYF